MCFLHDTYQFFSPQLSFDVETLTTWANINNNNNNILWWLDKVQNKMKQIEGKTTEIQININTDLFKTNCHEYNIPTTTTATNEYESYSGKYSNR